MTDLPPVQYLEQAWRELGPIATGAMANAHARALHRIAELEAKLPKETLEQVAAREAEKRTSDHGEKVLFMWGFLRAAEMAKKGELPDE